MYDSVSKEVYQAWERDVINTYFGKADHRFVKKKVLVFAYRQRDIHSLVAARRRTAERVSLFEKTKIQLYHAGKGDSDGVSYGFDREKGDFKFPATDTGGLTNAVAKVSSPFRFVPVPACATESEAYAMWKQASGVSSFSPPSDRPSSPSVFSNFRRWVRSVKDEDSRFKLGLWSPPNEVRFVVPARQVKDQIGCYFVRVFGDESAFARPASETELETLLCSVAETFVTPNLNRANLRNEYSKEKSD